MDRRDRYVNAAASATDSLWRHAGEQQVAQPVRHPSGRWACCGGYGEHAELCPWLEGLGFRPVDFWDRVEIRPGDCWPWLGYITPAGYGQFKRNLGAYRVAYELTHGAVPEGLVIDHLCRNRACCNPDHMEPVTNEENLRRAIGSGHQLNAAKTHCPRGHEYTPDNTYVENGRRHCRTCNDTQKRESKRRHRPPVQSSICGDPRGADRCRLAAGHAGPHKTWGAYGQFATWEARER